MLGGPMMQRAANSATPRWFTGGTSVILLLKLQTTMKHSKLQVKRKSSFKVAIATAAPLGDSLQITTGSTAIGKYVPVVEAKLMKVKKINTEKNKMKRIRSSYRSWVSESLFTSDNWKLWSYCFSFFRLLACHLTFCSDLAALTERNQTAKNSGRRSPSATLAKRRLSVFKLNNQSFLSNWCVPSVT